MEAYSYTTYPDSGDSSPRSRDIDCENLASWDDPPQPSSPPTNYRVKFMCSYAGKIIPRPHDNQLSYVGGHTKILTVDRTISLTSFISKLSSLAAAADSDDICFKYQLPGEDLDALISVTNSEDLHHMMMEYDRLLLRSSPKPARLRLFLFLFPVNPSPPSDAKSDRQWFLDALNSAPPTDIAPPTPVAKPPPLKHPPELNIPTEEVVLLKPAPVKEEAAEIQRQILQIAEQQAMFQQRRGEEPVSRVFAADYYPQKPQEKVAPPPMGYWHERQISTPTAGFSAGTAGFPATTAGGGDQVYLISTPMYRPPSPGQGYYVPRVVQEGYRESPVYGMGPTQAQKVAAAVPYGEGVVRQQGVGVAYDNAGREVYYNAPGGVVTSYQTVAASGVPAVVTMTQEAGEISCIWTGYCKLHEHSQSTDRQDDGS